MVLKRRARFPPAKSREPPTEGAAWNTGVRVEDVFVVSYKKSGRSGKKIKKKSLTHVKIKKIAFSAIITVFGALPNFTKFGKIWQFEIKRYISH